jgi:hypothetical protein
MTAERPIQSLPRAASSMNAATSARLIDGLPRMGRWSPTRKLPAAGRCVNATGYNGHYGWGEPPYLRNGHHHMRHRVVGHGDVTVRDVARESDKVASRDVDGVIDRSGPQTPFTTYRWMAVPGGYGSTTSPCLASRCNRRTSVRT